jgi:hypothetical protein
MVVEEPWALANISVSLPAVSESKVQHSTAAHGRGWIEACPFAGIIQIKFNGISQNESCRSNHRTPVMLIPKTYDDRSSSSKHPKKSQPTELTLFLPQINGRGLQNFH